MLSKVFVVVFCLTVAMASHSNDVEEVFKTNGIVTDVIAKAPSQMVHVSYSSGVTVDLGNELTPTQVKDQPTVQFDRKKDSFYTLIMTDPDAPSRKEPIRREFLHWTVVNIPGDGDLTEGETLFGYVGSGPPKDTGLHRYVFLVYEQSGKLDFKDEPHVSNRSRDHRPNFSTMKFAERFGLGNPIAANFYQAQYDDYVPILHNQFE